ncbi:hypothetical protein SS50377_25787 [Spironucleus salmonicida]|uniref:Uncharacterized protein n=1 Tax=Spironucleus salmonicida TaxID=348837 RepID=V6LVI1_9EUKA|nr:hypothetical protein SS50377_25781 [Spironucleus salmonicida]KAH0571598.1 hypothetical protein SS50377_25787 [Spironucleus salmonicida]|eukprot:EST48237.1 Hypothetical protein SS50377_11579 [Spironucleus salmonicida]
MDANHITQTSIQHIYKLNALRSTIALEYEKISRDIQELRRIQVELKLPLSLAMKTLNDLMVEKSNQLHKLDLQIKMFALACTQAEKTLEEFAFMGPLISRITYPEVAVRSRVLVEFRK